MHAVFAKIVSNTQRNWCQLLDHVTYAYNCATHASTSFSPYYLLHLRHPKVPLELLIEKPTAAAVQSADEFVQSTANRMRQAYAVVRGHLQAAFDRSKKRYDARLKAARFDVGDFVYYYVPRKHIGRNRKWALDNRGPFHVQCRINDVNYVIQKSPASTPIIVHIDRLTKYHLTDAEIPQVWRNYKDTKRTVSGFEPRMFPASVDNDDTSENYDGGQTTDERQALNPDVQPFVPRAAPRSSSDRQAPMASSLPMPTFDGDPTDMDSSSPSARLQSPTCSLQNPDMSAEQTSTSTPSRDSIVPKGKTVLTFSALARLMYVLRTSI